MSKFLASRLLDQSYTDGQVTTLNASIAANTASIAAITPVAGTTGQAVTVTKFHSALTDNTATDSLSITVPNTTGGGAIKVTVAGTLGDGDASDAKEYIVAISRIAGANALIAISSAIGAAAVTGATANSATTLTNTAVSGAVGATNTFKLQVKVARSTGSSSGHQATVRATVYPNATGQIVVAAL